MTQHKASFSGRDSKHKHTIWAVLACCFFFHVGTINTKEQKEGSPVALGELWEVLINIKVKVTSTSLLLWLENWPYVTWPYQLSSTVKVVDIKPETRML